MRILESAHKIDATSSQQFRRTFAVIFYFDDYRREQFRNWISRPLDETTINRKLQNFFFSDVGKSASGVSPCCHLNPAHLQNKWCNRVCKLMNTELLDALQAGVTSYFYLPFRSFWIYFWCQVLKCGPIFSLRYFRWLIKKILNTEQSQ